VTRHFRTASLLAVGLVLGSAFTVGAVTTIDPVTLCIKKDAVRLSDTDRCTARETRVQVASADDAAALAGRLDSDEAAIAALEASNAAHQVAIQELVAVVFPGELTAEVIPGFGVEFHGTNLEPGSAVTGYARLAIGGTFAMEVDAVAAPDGTFYYHQPPLSCVGLTLVVEEWVTGAGRSGEAVESNHVDPC
jgi:hypothetical protein